MKNSPLDVFPLVFLAQNVNLSVIYKYKEFVFPVFVTLSIRCQFFCDPHKQSNI